MLRKTMMVFATAAVLSGGLTGDAAALATAHSGWDGLGDGGAHASVPTPARDQNPPRLQRSELRLVVRLLRPHDCPPVSAG